RRAASLTVLSKTCTRASAAVRTCGRDLRSCASRRSCSRLRALLGFASPSRSSLLLHQADEDIFERALRRLQILEDDAGIAQPVEQRHAAGPLAFRVVSMRPPRAAVGGM